MMHGRGVLQKVEGGKYRGEFWNGLRSGVGSEEFGNTAGVTFRCPMGVKHHGDGFCVYTGERVHFDFCFISSLFLISAPSLTGQFQTGYFHGHNSISSLHLSSLFSFFFDCC